MRLTVLPRSDDSACSIPENLADTVKTLLYITKLSMNFRPPLVPVASVDVVD